LAFPLRVLTGTLLVPSRCTTGEDLPWDGYVVDDAHLAALAVRRARPLDDETIVDVAPCFFPLSFALPEAWRMADTHLADSRVAGVAEGTLPSLPRRPLATGEAALVHSGLPSSGFRIRNRTPYMGPRQALIQQNSGTYGANGIDTKSVQLVPQPPAAVWSVLSPRVFSFSARGLHIWTHYIP
jgi:hypothetical protein